MQRSEFLNKNTLESQSDNFYSRIHIWKRVFSSNFIEICHKPGS